MQTIQFNVGKLSVRSPKYPSESGFVTQIRSQMKELQTVLTDWVNQLELVTPQIFMEALQPTFAKAKSYCPVDTGALINSAYLEITSYRDKPRVEMGFARGGVPEYAVYVHEMTEHFHKPPTRSKFLQAAINEDLGAIQDRVVKAYRALTR